MIAESGLNRHLRKQNKHRLKTKAGIDAASKWQSATDQDHHTPQGERQSMNCPSSKEGQPIQQHKIWTLKLRSQNKSPQPWLEGLATMTNCIWKKVTKEKARQYWRAEKFWRLKVLQRA